MTKPKRSSEEVSWSAFHREKPVLNAITFFLVASVWLGAVGVLALAGWGIFWLVMLAWDVYQAVITATVS